CSFREPNVGCCDKEHMCRWEGSWIVTFGTGERNAECRIRSGAILHSAFGILHSMTTGRFAPSPTGPLHLGSFVAALGSYWLAKREGGRWLVRIEDLDTPRVVPGSAEEILGALQRYGLQWDGEVVYQSQRTALYENPLKARREKGLVDDWAGWRGELRSGAWAPLGREPIYPGTCRGGIAPGRTARAV